jgi:hypothetical protein
MPALFDTNAPKTAPSRSAFTSSTLMLLKLPHRTEHSTIIRLYSNSAIIRLYSNSQALICVLCSAASFLPIVVPTPPPTKPFVRSGDRLLADVLL